MPALVSTSFSHQSLGEFLERLASGEATPGGGSASALAGALAASLVCMVCRLTLGREKFVSVSEQMQEMLTQAEGLRERLTSAVDADAEAYKAVLSAYALPRSDQAQRFARAESIQAALRQATRVPLAVAVDCARVLDMARVVVQVANPSAFSDSAVSELLAEAGLRGALRNVAINLPYVADTCFVTDVQTQVERLEAACARASS